jgi:hypothetical protein
MNPRSGLGAPVQLEVRLSAQFDRDRAVPTKKAAVFGSG